MPSVAVTGAGGYVGGRLVRQLAGDGVDVRAIVRRPTPWLPEARLADLATAQVEHAAKLLDGCDAVVHLAGASEVVAARDPDGAIATTVAASRRVAAAAKAARVPRLVYLSTVHVYGAALEQQSVIDEEVMPQPRHPYAVARLASEHLCAVADLEQLVVLRLTNSVGAPADPTVDRWTLVAMELAAAAAAGRPLVLRSSGQQWRDFVDLGEVCRALASAAAGAVPAGVYNLGSGRSRTVLDLARLVADVAGRDGPRPEVVAPVHEGQLPTEVRVDVDRLATHLPRFTVPLESSLRELIELCRQHPGAGVRSAED